MTGRRVPVVGPDELPEYLGRRAGIVTRLVANLVDWFVVVGFWLSLLVGWGVLVALLDNDPTEFAVATPPGWVTAIMITVGLVTYLTVMWAGNGRTIGKQLVGLRVLRADGADLGYGRSFARALLCVFFPGTVGLLWVAVSRRNRSWQDVWLRTAVVYDWKPRESSEAVREHARRAKAVAAQA